MKRSSRVALLALLPLAGVFLACSSSTPAGTTPDLQGPYACGSATCQTGQACIHPCVGGGVTPCVAAELPEAGAAPDGGDAGIGADAAPGTDAGADAAPGTDAGSDAGAVSCPPGTTLDTNECRDQDFPCFAPPPSSPPHCGTPASCVYGAQSTEWEGRDCYGLCA